MTHYIDERADFGIIRYANCWEDTDILYEALQPALGKRILSIASAGDNSLALLAGGCEVVAVDLSPAQLACVELRVAAFRNLAYEEVLSFLGVADGLDRRATYQSLKQDLSAAARSYWDQHVEWIVDGVIHAGKFEDYFRKFRTRVLPLVHRKSRVEQLLHEKPPESQREFYDRTWNTWRWRWLFKIFFSRFVMGRLGRDPEFFRFVEGSVADRLLERTEYALTALPTHSNPYLNFILTGHYGSALPRYLRREHFEDIRDGLDRLQLFQGTVEDAAVQFGTSGFDGFNLSDIFEYLDETTCHSIFEELLSVANAHARLAYWNMLVPRQRPAVLGERIQSLSKISTKLFAKDSAWFYSRFVVEEVR